MKLTYDNLCTHWENMKIPKQSKKILIIPDAHVTNGQDLSRFDKVRSIIDKRHPDIILIGGDFADILSLSSFDKNNKLTIEGRRYRTEIDAVNTALDKLLSYNKRGYTPRLIYLIGNHETRVARYVDQNPQLDGHMDVVSDLKLKQRNFEVIPYKKFIEIDNILFTHVPINAAGQPLTGKFAAQKAADLMSKSLVFFHVHQILQCSCIRHGDEELIQVYNAGCFFPGDPPGGYSDDSAHATSKAISILTTYSKGRFDVEQISLERLMHEAG